MTTVLLADDEKLLRSALASLLEMEPDLTVVAQADNGREAVHAAARLRPDVVLLDLEMPELDGIEAALQILQRRPEQPIILLTRHGRPGVLRRALQAGVRGFVPKSIEPADLARIIAEVHSGRRYIDSEISTAAMMNDCPLSSRELDALRLTRDGLSIADISASLHLAPGTVRNYISAAMQKTGGSNRHDAARRATEHGWL